MADEITKLYESGKWAHNDGTVAVVVHVSKGSDPFTCQGLNTAALCGGADMVAGTKFQPVVGVEPPALGPSRARFVFEATYMKFQHDALQGLSTRITHAPISPLDGHIHFALQSHTFPLGDKVTDRLPAAARPSEFPYIDPTAPGASTELQKCHIATAKAAGV